MLGAVLAGDAETAASMLDTDRQLANLADRDPERLSVLHLAARRGDLAIVELLLGAGANVDKRAHDGSTALHEAALGGHLEIARLLVAFGAETRATTNSGYSVLEAARMSGNQALTDLLASLPQPTIRYTFRGEREWSYAEHRIKRLFGALGAISVLEAQRLPRPPTPENYSVGVRHDVADVSVLLTAERTDSTCCSASSILPGRASPVTTGYEAPGTT